MVIKWSPDGRKLVFTNKDENQELWVFVYDVAENTFQKFYKVPAGRYAADYKWSTGSDSITLQTVNAKCCNPGWAYFQINLSDGTIERLPTIGFWINSVTQVNSQSICFQRTKPVQRMQSAGYSGICYFPDMGLYGGLKNGENAVDYDLLSEDGQVQRTLFRFPVDFTTNGSIDLLLSPDKSRVLMMVEPLRMLGTNTEGGIPFAISISMTETSIGIADPGILYFEEPAYLATPPPHELMGRFVYGWSLDSKSYLEARFYYDRYDRSIFLAQGEFVIINAETGDVIYTYVFKSDLQPLTTSWGDGFHIVWSGQP